MKLCCIGHDFRYETEKLCRLFLPFEKIEVLDALIDGINVAVTWVDGRSLYASVKTENSFCEKRGELPLNFDDREAERQIAALLFKCFAEVTDYAPKWGIVTGIRPARLYSAVVRELGSQAAAKEYFKNEFYVQDEKISLCEETHMGEEKIISLSEKSSFSLYISIPFCPTRCSYCSFVSHAVEKAEKLIPEYVEYLCREIKETALIAKRLNLRLETVYMGGGTPTTLSAQQLTRVLSLVKECFDFSFIREFTVEAGRPDTITEEKLLALKNCGVDRISINPQSMSNQVLKVIGRAHTAEQTVEAFKLARKIGFDNINMDLIAGLPGDTLEAFKDTLGKILALDPESVTVHSLSMKRSSRMNVSGDFPEIEVGRVADKMVTYARETLTKNGILPYYMYRQSKTVGNLENVGYAKINRECLYNVYIMDETHTILACGASAVTKMREPGGDYIERIFNFKYPYEYISRFNELMDRKNGIEAFYNKYPIN
ncbi:MAG: coproporphyrinogen dehydrogenase HemZ [Clostridia bacterium]|nr:coproporphyrinogen dehydrogenase HemZ [Clostridia bacterium]